MGGLAFFGEWMKCSPSLESGDLRHLRLELATEPYGLTSPSDRELFLDLSLPLCPDLR